MKRHWSGMDLLMRACCGVLALCFLCILARIAAREALLPRLGEENAIVRLLLNNRMHNDTGAADTAPDAACPAMRAYLTAVKRIERTLETDADEYLPLYTRIVETAAAAEARAGWTMGAKYDYDITVRFDDGYFSRCLPPDDMADVRTFLAELNARLAEADIPFLYVQVPSKICRCSPRRTGRSSTAPARTKTGCPLPQAGR